MDPKEIYADYPSLPAPTNSATPRYKIHCMLTQQKRSVATVAALEAFEAWKNSSSAYLSKPRPGDERLLGLRGLYIGSTGCLQLEVGKAFRRSIAATVSVGIVCSVTRVHCEHF